MKTEGVGAMWIEKSTNLPDIIRKGFFLSIQVNHKFFFGERGWVAKQGGAYCLFFKLISC